VNLFLEVTGQRADGFHNLVSVVREIDLADRLEAEPDGDGAIRITCTGDAHGASAVPEDEENLAVRAARRLREEAGIRDGIRFRLEKRIPVGGGLGGGSADAAAALRLACRVWGLAPEPETLGLIGAEIGSDVPFFLHGGTCLVEGRGERVTPLFDTKTLPLALAMPPWSIPTGPAYAALAGLRMGDRSPEAFLRALRAGDREAVAAESFNRFEEVIGRIEPRQEALHRALAAAGHRPVRLSGSGSTVWTLEEEPQAGESTPANARPARPAADAGSLVRAWHRVQAPRLGNGHEAR
jgi:4-diphosphocytidyl-2-C-methyl-D-erythritol kinase